MQAGKLREIDRLVLHAELRGRSAPVLILDDVVDSGWTLTVIAARLRQAGADVVIPFALSYAGAQ